LDSGQDHPPVPVAHAAIQAHQSHGAWLQRRYICLQVE
jgi:hypothetical protein